MAVAPVVFATHPAPRVAHLCRRLRERGIQAWPLPAFAIEPADAAGLAAAAAHLSDYDWVVPVSPTAVSMLADALGATQAALRGGMAAGVDGPVVALVGQGSADALIERCPAWRDRAVWPERGGDAQALLALPALQQPAGRRVLLVRGEQGRDELAATLRARGARVDEVRAYRRAQANWPPDSIEALDEAVRAGARGAFVFSVSEAPGATRDALRTRSAAHWAWAAGEPALAVHDRIVARGRADGWRRTLLVDAGIDALVAALESA